MSWKSMHWEKIPWSIAGREVWRKQVEEATKQDIPVRLVRARQKDGKEVGYWEKFVAAKDCDVKDCTSKSSNIITTSSKDHYTEIAMCSYHYHEYEYGEEPELTLDMKDNVYAKYYDN